MGSDLRYAFRTLLRTPTFTALAMLTLSLGLGSVTAMFAVVNAVLLRPLPYHEPHRLVVTLHGDSANGPVSPADYLDYRREAQSFADMAAAQAWGVTLSADGRSDRLPAMKVSPDLMPLLGVAPALGRSFRPGDDQPGADRVVILSHALWQDRFGADPVIVGRTIRLSGEAYDVVGVMPAGFRFAPFWQTRPALWSPLTLATRMDDRAGRSLRVFARLRDGIEVAQAQAEMSTLGRPAARVRSPSVRRWAREEAGSSGSRCSKAC